MDKEDAPRDRKASANTTMRTTLPSRRGAAASAVAVDDGSDIDLSSASESEGEEDRLRPPRPWRQQEGRGRGGARSGGPKDELKPKQVRRLPVEGGAHSLGVLCESGASSPGLQLTALLNRCGDAAELVAAVQQHRDHLNALHCEAALRRLAQLLGAPGGAGRDIWREPAGEVATWLAGRLLKGNDCEPRQISGCLQSLAALRIPRAELHRIEPLASRRILEWWVPLPLPFRSPAPAE